MLCAPFLARFEVLVDQKGLVPLEYQQRMLQQRDTLKRLDTALTGNAPGWTPEQAEVARELVRTAHETYMDACGLVAALPVEERRDLAKQATAELNSFDQVNRTIVQVQQTIN